MKKVITLLSVMLFVCAGANAQNYLNQLGQRAKNRAKYLIEQKVNNAVDRAVDNAFDTTENAAKDAIKGEKKNKKNKNQEADGWTCPDCGTTGNTGNFCASCGAKKPEPQPAAADGWTCPECGATGNTGNFCQSCGAKKPDPNAAAATWTCEKCGHAGNTGNFCDECGAKKGERKIESAYAKSDFVPGDEVIFDDTLEGEQLGEFPSKWDLLRGTAEVAKFDGKMAIFYDGSNTSIAPLMKDPKNYLTDEFTIETDFFAGDNSHISDGQESRSEYELYFNEEGGDTVCDMDLHTADSKYVRVWYVSTSGNSTRSEADITAYLVDGQWNHLAISFNKRAFKVYINGTRVINIPNMKAPRHMDIAGRLWDDHAVNYITNFRICKGAVPLYDRLTTEGKIVTYAITFESGKADLKPESMVEIVRIAKLMQDNPNLNFEVQGHCDSTGSDQVNDPLSQKRAEAIVASLVEQGIAQTRLTAVGKGSHSPIADNSTDEGRAKNRRVEFVKK